MRRYIIPIFIPHAGCPHQCVFCDQRTITGARSPVDAGDVTAIIIEHLARTEKQRPMEIAFYGGSFTALPVKRQLELLAPATAALKSGAVQAIRLSTRPDCIDRETVGRLSVCGVSTVELGAQSLDDKVLAAAGRGHGSADTVAAVGLLKKFGLNCGLQLMPGLPGEDWYSLINTGKKVVELNPDFARVYPTVVIAGTPLENMYRAGQYKPLLLTEAVSRAAYLKKLFDDALIPVIRYGLQATENLSAPGTVVAGPYHPAFGEMVAAYLFNIMVCHAIESLPQKVNNLTIQHHPKDSSKLRGLANANRLTWMKNYGLKVCIMTPSWPRLGEIAVNADGIDYIINISMLNNC